MLDFLTVTEVAARLGVTSARAYQLVREARLPHVRRGRRLLIPAGAWAAWLREQERQALAVIATKETERA